MSFISFYFVFFQSSLFFLCLKSINAEILRGVIVQSPPFVRKINDHYEGYAIDLITELAKLGDFNFTLYTIGDNNYGSLDNPALSSAVINEIIQKRADFAVTDLTKSMLRKRYVHFTDSFMSFDLSALINKKFKGNISSFSDLIDQQEVDCGSLSGGVTFRFMSTSYDPIIMGLQRFIYRNFYRNVFVNTIQEGIEKAKNSKYAFIQDSVTNDYIMDENCELTSINGEKEYFVREFAIALQKGREDLLELFNQGIQQLKFNGTLERLKLKYWNKYCMRNTIPCSASSDVITSISRLVVSVIILYLSLN